MTKTYTHRVINTVWTLGDGKTTLAALLCQNGREGYRVVGVVSEGTGALIIMEREQEVQERQP